MKKLLLGLALVAFAAMGGTGCLVVQHPDGSATIWTPVVGHVHDEHCGHYHRHGRWYFAKGHRHGPGCGHIWRGGMWCCD